MIEAAFLADGDADDAAGVAHAHEFRPLMVSIGRGAPGGAHDRWRGGAPHSEWRRLSVACEAPVSAEHVPVRMAGGG